MTGWWWLRSLVFLPLIVSVVCLLPQEQKDSLLTFDESFGSSNPYVSWNRSTDPCDDGWIGVKCAFTNDSVTELDYFGGYRGNRTGLPLPDLLLPDLISL